MTNPPRITAPLTWSEKTLPQAELASLDAGHIAMLTESAPGSEGPNEDSVAVVPLDDATVVIAVADGVGGAPLGSTASRLAVEAITHSVLDGAPDTSVRERILDGFERANRSVLDLGVGAATTLVVIEATPSTMRCYHTGDSAVLVTGQRGKLKLLTISHSPVGYAIEAGLLDAHEAMNHAERNIVSNLVGAADMRVEMSSPLALGALDTIVVGSDGLFDNLHVQEIVDITRRGPLLDAAGTLRDRCHARMKAPSDEQLGKPDDLTFVLFRPRSDRRSLRRGKKPSAGSDEGEKP